MALRLLQTSTLTITRFDTGGALLESGKYSTPSTTTFDIECSLQPFGDKTSILPEGYTANDARTVFTTTKLNTSSQFTKIPPDQTTIDGLVYEALAVSDWNQYNLTPDNFEVVFIRKDEAS